jgi:8-oxo-dGTP diphosphatase
MTTVAAALITRDSKLLICQRRRDDTHPLQWEFPGGKVEPGETPMQALERELQEELGVDAIVGQEVFRTSHRYRDSESELLLIFFRAEVDVTSPLQNLVFEGFEWADLPSLTRYRFLAADNELIALLSSGAIRLE